MEFFIKTFSSIFIIMGPFSVIPIFITMTRDNTRSEKDAIIKKAIMATLGISLLFAVAGHFFLRMFGITIQSFQMAGGLLILLMSINMLHADRSKVRVTPEEQKEGIQKEDISVFPLAVPLISGPGTLSTLVLLANEASTPFHWFSIISSIIVSAMLIY
jgi:multiple antibiotic resistance protein